jgi:hypothetical protein
MVMSKLRRTENWLFSLNANAVKIFGRSLNVHERYPHSYSRVFMVVIFTLAGGSGLELPLSKRCNRIELTVPRDRKGNRLGEG